VALAASAGWSLGVWWFGEGLGGVLTPAASPASGAPGAAVIYALLAVVLWPSDRSAPRSAFVAGRAVGEWPARVLWLVLWGAVAYLSAGAATRSPQYLRDMITQLASGEPSWVAGIDGGAARLLAGQGAAVSIGLALAFAVIAVGIFFPAPAARGTVVVAVAVSAAIWIVGENFGGMLTGSGTDPNSGPPLALLAVAYWRSSAPGRVRLIPPGPRLS